MSNREKLITTALWLAYITIFYNVAEGIISIFFGTSDETLALLGFGVDSFVEVISGIGILHMVFRMRKTGDDPASRDKFEKTALRITGFSFYLLTTGLVVGSILNVLYGSVPETTVPGIIISSISIATMWFLMTYKKKIGEKLYSEAIIADANCTKTCFYLSIVLLVSSGLYEIFRIGYIDIAGSLAIAWFAFSEGREAFEKAKSKSLSCGCGDGKCH
jgi:divalent metal cation (Fe/Co/Zn/Cd) transporter